MLYMKVIIFLTLLICSACNDHTVIPSFKSNSAWSDIPENIKSIIKAKEITIAYTPQGTALKYGITKLFCLKNGIWEKIEIRTNITELDTVYSSTEIGFVFKDVVIRQECRAVDATAFLHKLIENGLFNLVEEDELLKKCVPNVGITRYDAGSVLFRIIKGDRVRKLKYNYPWYQVDECSNVKEWSNILALKALFEDEWYAKEH